MRPGEDQLLDGRNLFTKVVLLELEQLWLDVLDKSLALSTLQLPKKLFYKGISGVLDKKGSLTYE